MRSRHLARDRPERIVKIGRRIERRHDHAEREIASLAFDSATERSEKAFLTPGHRRAGRAGSMAVLKDHVVDQRDLDACVRQPEEEVEILPTLE